MNANVTPLIDNPIELQLDKARIQLTERRNRWVSSKKIFDPIVNALMQIGVIPELGDNLTIRFTGDSHQLAAVVRILRTAGFSSNSRKPEVGDTEWLAWFSHPQSQLEIFLWFASSVCTRVKVGTKLVETDIYEVRCSGGAMSPTNLLDVVNDPTGLLS